MNRTGGKFVDQGQAAELIAIKWGISREELDLFALQSHQRAHIAQKEGRFDKEITPLRISNAEGADKVFDKDETIRPETSMEALAGLKPVFGTKMMTAGNSSPISDGASAVLLMSDAMVKNLGITPRARIVTSAVAGADPVMMLTGPIPATAKVMEKSGLKMQDFDRIEINEAFASVPLAWGKEYKPDWGKVNIQRWSYSPGTSCWQFRVSSGCDVPSRTGKNPWQIRFDHAVYWWRHGPGCCNRKVVIQESSTTPAIARFATPCE